MGKQQIQDLVESVDLLPRVTPEDGPMIKRFLENIIDKTNEFGNSILRGAKIMEVDATEEECLNADAHLCITPLSWGKMTEEIRAIVMEGAPEDAELPNDADTFLRVTLSSAPFVDYVNENTDDSFSQEDKLKLMIYMHYNLCEHANQVSPFIAAKARMTELGISIPVEEVAGVCDCEVDERNV